MTTKRAKQEPGRTATTRPPQPIIYTVELRLPIRLIAFHHQDAVDRVRQFAAALAGLVDASAPESFVLGDGRLKLQGREKLQLSGS